VRIALWAIILKELRQTFRDKRTAALLIVAPVIQLIVLGFAVNLEVDHVPTAIVDLDRTPESRRFADGLVAGETFEMKGNVDTGEEAIELIDHGKVCIAVVLPAGFERSLGEGLPTQVQLLVDGGDSNRAIIAQNAATAYTTQVGFRLAMDRAQQQAAALGVFVKRPALLQVQARILYNLTLNSHIYFVPGVGGTLLLVVTVIVTSMGLAREKEAGTMEQIMVTPMSPMVVILGKTLPYALIAFVDLGLVVAGGALIFKVPIRGQLWLIGLAGILYILTTLGIGLLISTVAKSQQQSFMLAFFFMMPAILLSGFMTPIANMPHWLQLVTHFNPVRHLIEVLRAVLLKAATFSDVAPQLVALGGLGITVFLLAVMAMQRQLK